MLYILYIYIYTHIYVCMYIYIYIYIYIYSPPSRARRAPWINRGMAGTPLTARRRMSVVSTGWRRAPLAGRPTVRVAIVGSRGTKRPLPGGPGRAPHWRVRPPLDSWSGSGARCLCAIFCLLALRVGLDPLLPCVGGGDCPPITGCKILLSSPAQLVVSAVWIVDEVKAAIVWIVWMNEWLSRAAGGDLLIS